MLVIIFSLTINISGRGELKASSTCSHHSQYLYQGAPAACAQLGASRRKRNAADTSPLKKYFLRIWGFFQNGF